jgi:hypothetical protein
MGMGMRDGYGGGRMGMGMGMGDGYGGGRMGMGMGGGYGDGYSGGRMGMGFRSGLGGGRFERGMGMGMEGFPQGTATQEQIQREQMMMQREQMMMEQQQMMMMQQQQYYGRGVGRGGVGFGGLSPLSNGVTRILKHVSIKFPNHAQQLISRLACSVSSDRQYAHG